MQLSIKLNLLIALDIISEIMAKAKGIYSLVLGNKRGIYIVVILQIM